jgi:hypothetical protein
MTHMLPHHETGCQWSINNIWFCIFGLTRLYTDQSAHSRTLDYLYCQNTTYNRKIMDLELINIASCAACKHLILVFEYAILMRYY